LNFVCINEDDVGSSFTLSNLKKKFIRVRLELSDIFSSSSVIFSKEIRYV